MEESNTYQAIIQKGMRQGELHEIKRIMLLQGRKRFGEPPLEIPAALEAIEDLEFLEPLSEHLLDVASWEELLATP